MKPKLIEACECNNSLYEKVISIITEFDAEIYFKNLIKNSQIEQKKIVTTFQNDLFFELSNKIPKVKWKLEYKPKTDFKDAVDIYGKVQNFIIVVELDKHRADQIAKKFLSRTALFAEETIFYISLCYPGTSKMSVNEAKKYFNYCNIVSKKLGNCYAGFIISNIS